MAFSMMDCEAVEVVPFRNGNEYAESYRCGLLDGMHCVYKVCPKLDGKKVIATYKGHKVKGNVRKCFNGAGYYNAIVTEWNELTGSIFIPDSIDNILE